MEISGSIGQIMDRELRTHNVKFEGLLLGYSYRTHIVKAQSYGNP